MLRGGRNVVSVNLLVIGALGIGLLNNIVIAAIFGLTRRVDAFFAAMIVPNLFIALCIDYLGKNFLPVFAIAKQKSDETAFTMTSSIVTIVALLAVATTAVLLAISKLMFTYLLPGFHGADLDLVTRYFWIMAPAIVFMAINSFHEYVCQYDEQFVYVAASRLALPGANLAGMLLLAPFIGEYCLPCGFLIGHATEFLMLLRRVPYRYRPRIDVSGELERRVFANTAVVMSTGLIARTRSIIMNYLASTLGGGAIAALGLATKLTEPLERGSFVGARMVMFSHTARLFVERKERELGLLYANGLKIAFLLLAPLVWWIGYNSTEIVRAFFVRGEFTPEMAGLVGLTLTALIPSVLFLGVNPMLSNAFYAMNRVKVPALVMPFGTVVYVGVAVPLSRLLGTEGLALATTATSVTVFLLMLFALSKIVQDLHPLRTLQQLAIYGILAGVSMAAGFGLLSAFELPPSVVAAASLPIGVAVYVMALALFGDATYQQLVEFGRGFLVARRAEA